jgi:gliding motility-associated-like protein
MLKRLWLLFFLGIFTLANGQEYIKSIQEPQKDFLFEENKGQFHDDIAYKTDLPIGEMYLCEDRFVYHFRDAAKLSRLLQANHSGGQFEDASISCHNYEVRFVGANTGVLLTAEDPTITEYNYFLGNDRSKWATKVKKFKKVVYSNIYDRIDLVVYSFYNTVKYEFRVHPEGNPEDIKMEFNGLDSLFDQDGMLGQATSIGTTYEQKPYSYQLIGDEQVEVKTGFMIRGNEVTFGLADYAGDRELIIDPQLIFATYSGSTADNWGNTACLDNEGNLYSGGTIFNYSRSTVVSSGVGQFPATLGSYENTFQGGDTDIGILKFDSSGAQLLYATYLGGNDAEIPTSIITNDNGELFILSMSGSSDFPMPEVGAFDRVFNGGISRVPVGGYEFKNGTDIVVSKLSSDGSQLLKSTYIGGDQNDGMANATYSLEYNYGDQLRGDLQVDDDDNLYIASVTSSSNFPTTSGAMNTAYKGGATDGVLVKLAANFESLLWSTYIGGADDDNCLAIKLRNVDDLYIGGGTSSSNDFLLPNGLYADPIGGIDGYVAQVEPDGSGFINATRLGTVSYDQVYFIDVDDNDNVYALGQTTGSYEINGGVYDEDPNAGQFIHKLNPDLDSTMYSFVFGRNRTLGFTRADVSPTAFLVNECENMFVSGWGGIGNNGVNTSTIGMPISADAYQSTTDGRDFWFGVFAADGSEMIYSTFYGGTNSGEHVDGGTSRFDKTGIIYQSVCAGCGSNDDFVNQSMIDDPLINVYSAINGSGNCNNGVLKFDLANVFANINTEDVCVEEDVVFENNTVGGELFIWNFGDGSPEEQYTDKSSVSHTYSELGAYLVTLVVIDSATCKIADTTNIELRVYEPHEPVYQADTICLDATKGLSIPTYPNDESYLWLPDSALSSNIVPDPTATGVRNIRYLIEVTDTIGCMRTDTFDITVPIIRDTLDFELFNSCDLNGNPRIEILSLGGHETDTVFVLWDFGDGATSTEWNPEHTYDGAGSYIISLQTSYGGCTWDTSFVVDLDDFNIPNVFTPNDDGKNDVFKVLKTEDSGPWEFSFYNRWGKLLFKSEDYQNDYKADDVNDGTYYYLIVSPDGTKCKNWVQLTR